MEYFKTIKLKDGRECVLRNGTEMDGNAVHEIFNLTHGQTDFLLSYPDENSMSASEEADFLKKKTESPNEIEIVAELDGRIVGTAGIECVGAKEKTKHRAELGIGIDKNYWGLGIGCAMLKACIECAVSAGYSQLELDVVSENERALSLYKKLGFVEYGRNPKGFRSRVSGWQPLVLMYLDLTK